MSPKFNKSSLVVLYYSWHCLSGHGWPQTIENDKKVWLWSWFRAFGGLYGRKLVKNWQKLTKIIPKFPKVTTNSTV